VPIHSIYRGIIFGCLEVAYLIEDPPEKSSCNLDRGYRALNKLDNI
jgi:hypothetical protein